MTWFRALLVKLGWRGVLEKLRHEIDEELRFHLDMKFDSNLKAGMDETEARVDARRRLGNVEAIHDSGARILAGAPAHSFGGGPLFAFYDDLKTALRHVRHSPGYAISTIAVLSLGIAASTTVFTYLRSYQQPFPGADSESLVRVFNRTDADAYGELSYPDFMDLTRENVSAFAGLAADQSGYAASVRFEDRGTGVLFGQAVTGSYFTLLDIEMSLGRPILPEDDRPDAPPTVLLSFSYWQTEFNADPSIVGRTLHLNNNPYTIIGVVGPEFRGSSAATRPDVWLPFEEYKRVYWARSNRESNREISVMRVYGRLTPGTDVRLADTELEAFGAGLDASAPLEVSERDYFVAPATWIHPRAREAEATTNRVMLAAAVGLLLLACANVANLLLSVAARRAQELALRAAQGASPWRLVRQALTENLLLASISGAVALLVAEPAAARLGSYFDRPSVWGSAVPREVSIDLHVFLFALAVTILTGVAVGILPAVRVASRNLMSLLWSGAGKTRLRGGRGGRALLGARDVLVALQVSMTVVLLVIGGLVLRSLDAVQGVDAGFDTDNLVSSYISVSSMGLPIEDRKRFYRELVARFNEESWVAEATVAAQAPLSGHPTEDFRFDGFEDDVSLTVGRVVPGFFETVEMEVTAGRTFAITDDEDAPGVVVVNETAASLYFQNQNPVGRQVWSLDDEGNLDNSYEVVGVVSDARVTTLLGDPEPVLYYSYPQHYYTPGNAFLVSTTIDPAAAVPLLRQELRNVSPRLAIVNALPYSRVVSGFTYPQRMNAELYSVLAVVGLILSTVGLFGVLSLAVGERTREIGVRLALGSPHRRVVLFVASRASVAVLIGGIVGMAASFVAAPLIRSLLFGVEPSDPISLAFAPLLLLFAASLATWIPTRRALSVDPVRSLREE